MASDYFDRGPTDYGRISAKVFAAFDAGTPFRTIVKTLNVPPSTVRELYREWRRPNLEEGVAAEESEAARAARAKAGAKRRGKFERGLDAAAARARELLGDGE